MADLAMALAVLAIAVLPVGYSFMREREVLRIEYVRAVADELVDGEMEILAAGAARDLPEGTQPYTVHANAAKQLPPGHFELTRTGNHLGLEWKPDGKGHVPVVREATLK